MAKVGIFFGSDTGKTRKVAKLIQDAFASDDVAAPVNINKASIADLLAYDYLIPSPVVFFLRFCRRL